VCSVGRALRAGGVEARLLRPSAVERQWGTGSLRPTARKNSVDRKLGAQSALRPAHTIPVLCGLLPATAAWLLRPTHLLLPKSVLPR
jgi:hypothetical protein